MERKEGNIQQLERHDDPAGGANPAREPWLLLICHFWRGGPSSVELGSLQAARSARAAS